MVSEGVAPTETSLFAPLHVRDFRLLWFGIGTSGLGDQFTYVALPWLALQLTGDELFVGLTRTMTGLAAGAFMLVGGALAHRISPRRMMLLSNGGLCALAALTALAVTWDAMTPALLLTVAFLFGAGGAFFDPAYYAVFPRLLPARNLNAGNALMTLTFQLGGVFGPGAAGLVLAAFGVAVSFGIDALTFGVAVVALWLMRPAPPPVSHDAEAPGGLLSDIRAGVGFALADTQLCALLLFIFLVNGVFGPSVGVGVPVLAATQFGGASALGVMFAGTGIGALAGALLAGTRYAPRALGGLLAGACGVLGLGAIGLAFAPTAPVAALCTAATGLMTGLVNIRVMAWLQARVPVDRLGRVMSLVMFGAVALQPLGFAVAGVVARQGVAWLLVGCGGVMLLMAAYTLSVPQVRGMRTS